MAALTSHFQYVNLSFTFDALTIYPTFEYYEHPNLRNCLNTIVGECNHLEFVIKMLCNEEPTKENLNFVNGLESIMAHNTTKCQYERFIRRDDDDHALYHKDDFKLNDSHWHIKFKNFLNTEQLEQVLDVFVKNGLLHEDERMQFLTSLDKRYLDERVKLKSLLKNEKKADVDQIIAFIRQCSDNDSLIEIHKYLLNKEFDYLREKHKDEVIHSLWQGTNQNDAVVPTTRSWAMVEKMLSLQLAHNIEKGCSKFTPALGHERASQFASDLPFFAIKRKVTPRSGTSKMFEALDRGNESLLDEKYNSMSSRKG